MSKKNKLGVVITDGVGYRNFILSNFITDLKDSEQEFIIISCLPKSIYGDLNDYCTIIEIDIIVENFYNWFFRKAKELSHLSLNLKDNFGIQDNYQLMYSKSKSIRGYATRFLHLLSRFTGTENWIQFFYSLQEKSFKNNKIVNVYQNILDEYNLTSLFFTHQRPPYIAPLISVAKRKGLKTSTFIFSWDNIASKGRMAGNFDHYFVWSSLMKNELLRFYRRVKPEQITIVGTPQFEPYIMNNYGYDKQALIKRFDLDQDKPIVLFTCNDSSSENDPMYLKILAKAIKDNKLTKSINLIVRTSPAEDPERFIKIKEEFSFIKWNFPDWNICQSGHQEPWSQRVPSIEDVNDLKSLLKHCDLCINVLSTITLDSYLFNKPVINPVFGSVDNEYFDDQKFLNYEHLKHLVKSKSSHIVTNESDYIKTINEILQGKDNKKDERDDFVKLEIKLPLNGTSKRIVQKIVNNFE